MVSREMTFSIPEEVAGRLVERVPAPDRSRYVSEAIAERLRRGEDALVRACETANRDPDVIAIEEEFDGLPEKISEPWTDAPTR